MTTWVSVRVFSNRRLWWSGKSVTTKISQEFNRDHDELQRALQIKDTFVRSDVQAGFYNARAKGRKLTAAEVYFNFGAQALNTLVDRGAFVIQNRNNSSSLTIKSRLEKLRISQSEFSNRLNVEEKVFSSWIEGYEYFPIIKLELACALLGIEESRISSHSIEYSEPLVRLRYYNQDDGDVNIFNTDLVNKISAQTWKVSKIEYLRAIVALHDKSERNRTYAETYIDPEYLASGAAKPTVEKGRQIATSVRGQLHLHKVRKRAVRVTEALDSIGASFYSDAMEDAFCGMTLISAWSGKRVVIANIRGENAKQTVRRFTLAHELAHAASDPETKFVTVKVGGAAGRTAGAPQTKGSKDYPERRANSFAANFLAPDEDMRAALAERPTEDAIDVICDEFVISRTAAKWRLVALGAISADTPSGHEENLFAPQIEDIGDTVPPINDELLAAADAAFERKLIHIDTVESIRSIIAGID